MCGQTPDTQLTLPTDHTASSLARRFLVAARCPVHNTVVLDEALLMVSELVTNAVSHGAPPITVKVTCRESDGLQVAVSDGSEGIPEPQEQDALSESGRGLFLVDLLSSRWGIEPTEDGKQVWFSLRPEEVATQPMEH